MKINQLTFLFLFLVALFIRLIQTKYKDIISYF